MSTMLPLLFLKARDNRKNVYRYIIAGGIIALTAAGFGVNDVIDDCAQQCIFGLEVWTLAIGVQHSEDFWGEDGDGVVGGWAGDGGEGGVELGDLGLDVGAALAELGDGIDALLEEIVVAGELGGESIAAGGELAAGGIGGSG